MTRVERVTYTSDGRRVEIPEHTGRADGWCARCQRHGCAPPAVDTWDDETSPHVVVGGAS